MKRFLIPVLTLVMLIPLAVQPVFAGVAPGILTEVYTHPGHIAVPHVEPGGDGRFFVVVPGSWYTLLLTNVELADGTTTVWIKGTTTTGTAWKIELTGQTVSSGQIETDPFQVPSNAGCTMVVAYLNAGHMAEDPIHAGTPGHMKTYYNDVSPHNDPVPCEAPGVPEYTFGSAILVSFGLIAAYALRRRHNKY